LKPLFSRIHFRLNRRLVIAGLLFILILVVTELAGGFSSWDIFPRILPSYNWLLWIVIFCIGVAFIDVIFYFTILVLLEFLVILAGAYIVSLTGLISFNSIFIYFEDGEHGAILTAGLYLISIIVYYRLWKHIPARNRNRCGSDFRTEDEEDNTDTETTEQSSHTKEELGRLLNLWQQKYAQAKTDEERKLANEMILKYTDELKNLREQNGTTPERARLNKGGESE